MRGSLDGLAHGAQAGARSAFGFEAALDFPLKDAAEVHAERQGKARGRRDTRSAKAAAASEAFDELIWSTGCLPLAARARSWASSAVARISMTISWAAVSEV